METNTSVKVTYWGLSVYGKISLDNFEGIDEFQKELAESYVSVIHGRPSGAGGGLYELAVEFVSNISLSDVVTFLSGGIAYDLLKSGSKRFLLRPFLAAYNRLKERNKGKKWNRIDIAEFRIVFQDSVLIIYKICDDSIFPELEKILLTIAAHYPKLALSSGEKPFEIYIPVFEDTSDDRLCRFRVLLDYDETIQGIKPTSYYNLWGLWYDYSSKFRVYDVTRKLLIDEGFYTQDRYWAKAEEKWRKAKEKK